MNGRPKSTSSWPQWVVALLVVAVLVTFVNVQMPRGPGHKHELSCMDNLSQLGQMCLMARQERGLDPTLHGSAQILSWFGVNGLTVGEERVFICPGDRSAQIPETADERRPFHPVDAAALRRAVGLGSYAVRDFEKFPLDEHATEKEIILCDRQGGDGRTLHHKRSIVVCYAGGDAQRMSPEDLGFDPDEPIVVGPDSPNPELRKMERP